MKEFEWYGIRADDKKYEIGEICELSHNWWQDDPEDGSEFNKELGLWDGGELDGTCAINCTDDLDNLSKIVDFVKRTYATASGVRNLLRPVNKILENKDDWHYQLSLRDVKYYVYNSTKRKMEKL